MALVKQRRVLWNTACLGLLGAVVLWLIRGHLGTESSAFVAGVVPGGLIGWLRWRHIRRRIARHDRRYERNKIFVDYLHIGEVAVAALAYNPVIALPASVGVAVALWLAPFSLWWWLVLVGSIGCSGASVLLSAVVCYERQHGPLYYQYYSDNWSGAEGLLYQRGTVLEPLQPAGKISMPGGVLWNAVSLSGEAIAQGEAVEVISVQGLTLYVDRLPAT